MRRRGKNNCCGPGKGTVLSSRGAFVLIFLLNLQRMAGNAAQVSFASTKVRIKDLQACLEPRPQEKERGVIILPGVENWKEAKLGLALRCQNLPRGKKKTFLY